MTDLYPIRLNHAGAWRVYLGGKRIRALCGEKDPRDDHYPEAWIVSTTPAAGAGAVPEQGLSRLAEQPSLFAGRDRSRSRYFLGPGLCPDLWQPLRRSFEAAGHSRAAECTGASGSLCSPAVLELRLRKDGVLAFSPGKNDRREASGFLYGASGACHALRLSESL